MRRVDGGYTHFMPQVLQLQLVGLELQHGVRVVQQQAEPGGAVVQQLGRAHVLGLQAQRGGHPGQGHGAGGAAGERRRGEGQACALAPDRHQPHLAFLHDLLRRQGLAAGLQPGVAAAQRGVAGKTHLAAGREDTHPVVGASGAACVCGRQQEGGFRQVGPVRKLQHLGIRQPVTVQHHGQRVAQQRGGRENIHLFKRAVASGGGRGQGRHTRE